MEAGLFFCESGTGRERECCLTGWQGKWLQIGDNSDELVRRSYSGRILFRGWAV
jgi:hypothetical protein